MDHGKSYIRKKEKENKEKRGARMALLKKKYPTLVLSLWP